MSDQIGSDPVQSDPKNPTIRSDPCTSLVLLIEVDYRTGSATAACLYYISPIFPTLVCQSVLVRSYPLATAFGLVIRQILNT